ATFPFGQETTAPVIGAERFLVAARPNFHTTIADHRQLNAFAVYLAERLAEIVCRTAGPIEKNVNAHELFVRRLSVRSRCMRLLAFAVCARLQNLRCLAQARDDSFRKLLCSNLLLAHLLVTDVISMYTVFDRPQPRVVNTLGMLGQAD